MLTNSPPYGGALCYQSIKLTISVDTREVITICVKRLPLTLYKYLYSRLLLMTQSWPERQRTLLVCVLVIVYSVAMIKSWLLPVGIEVVRLAETTIFKNGKLFELLMHSPKIHSLALMHIETDFCNRQIWILSWKMARNSHFWKHSNMYILSRIYRN